MGPSSDGSPRAGDAGEGRDAGRNRATSDDEVVPRAEERDARQLSVATPDDDESSAVPRRVADSDDAVMEAMMSGTWSRSDLVRVDERSTPEFEPPQRAHEVHPVRPRVGHDTAPVLPAPVESTGHITIEASTSKLPWAIAAGVSAFAIWYVVRTPSAPQSSERSEPPVSAPDRAVAGNDEIPPIPARVDAAAESTEGESGESPADAPLGRGLRVAPPGTPPEIAATFARLPVSPADLPPIGGIGSSGVHVDRLEMGSAYDKGMCAGPIDGFSLAQTDVVNVCLRVVHPRVEELLSIVWQKNDGSTARRGKIAVKPLHAYRTRAYLMLRKEYVGDWTVKILSPEGVELAAHGFSIVP